MMNTTYLAASAKKGLDPKAFREHGEQIYEFELFSPNFCKDLIQGLEQADLWQSESEVVLASPIDPRNPFHPKKNIPSTYQVKQEYLQTYFGIEDADEDYKSNLACSLHHLPQINTFVIETLISVVMPALKTLWPVFEGLFFEQPYIIQYDASKKPGMNLHADDEALALIVYLNDGFQGGGTVFPRWNLNLDRMPVGSAIVYPGSFSHMHAGAPIHSGKRYLLRAGFF